MKILCELCGMSRQNYYFQRRIREKLSVDERLVLELVHRERNRQSKLGGRKLLHLIQGDLQSAGVQMGRDRFFTFLRDRKLLIKRKRRGIRTTNSRHGFAVYGNLAKDLQVTNPHQLWVSDITYIRTLEGFMFLCLILDVYSRAIVGWDCSDSLEMEGTLRALEMALKQKPKGADTMHHSDRGVQYCCNAYTGRLKESGITISMTEENHCYENSMAERLNETVKYEYGLGDSFQAKSLVKPAAKEAVMLYNNYRPHLSLDMKKPMEVHKFGFLESEDTKKKVKLAA